MIDAILQAVEGTVTTPWVYLVVFAIAARGGLVLVRAVRHRRGFRAACP